MKTMIKVMLGVGVGMGVGVNLLHLGAAHDASTDTSLTPGGGSAGGSGG